MFLIDTNVISERRKGARANPGVIDFFNKIDERQRFLSAITLGEIRRGVEITRHRRDLPGSDKLQLWLGLVITEYASRILPVTDEIADLWGRLRVPHPENEIDKLIAATAMVYGMIVITRNVKDFARTGVGHRNPFT
jgi:toxin FitB